MSQRAEPLASHLFLAGILTLLCLAGQAAGTAAKGDQQQVGGAHAAAAAFDDETPAPCRSGCVVVAANATGDGVGLVTAELQAALDAAARRARPGSPCCATLPPGVHVAATVRLASDVYLWLPRRVSLLASAAANANFARDVDWPYQAGMVVLDRVARAGVVGTGVLDGQAPQFVTGYDAGTDMLQFRQVRRMGGLVVKPGRLTVFLPAWHAQCAGVQPTTSFGPPAPFPSPPPSTPTAVLASTACAWLTFATATASPWQA